MCNSAEGTKLLKKIDDSPISQLSKNIILFVCLLRFKPGTYYDDVILYTLLRHEKNTLVYD